MIGSVNEAYKGTVAGEEGERRGQRARSREAVRCIQFVQGARNSSTQQNTQDHAEQ